MTEFETTTFERRTDALSNELQELLGERGHLLRSYGIVNRLSCLKQALTRHDLNILNLQLFLSKIGFWPFFLLLDLFIRQKH